jgi:hypothetical protein
MSNEDKKSGQKIAIWGALGVLVGIVAIIVAVVIWQRPPQDRDFTMSVTPMRGKISQGGVTQTSIYVKGEGGYKHSVSLSASGQPSDVQIAFSPPFAPASPAFTSTMLVNVESKTTPGECEITIKGIGEDGREHSCKYTLNIMKRERDVIVTRLPEIKIVSPKRDEEVPLNVTVTGSFSGDIPEDRHMWVVINPQPSPGQWWLQGGKIEPWGGRWSVPATLGREEEDKGQEFDIAVILVNEEDNQKNEGHLETAIATGEYPSISIPRSAVIMDRITVKRK